MSMISLIPSLTELPSEQQMVATMIASDPFLSCDLTAIEQRACGYVHQIRDLGDFPLMERLMNLYSLSSAEGRVLMELAEALLRTPDEATREALIEDKLPHHHWLAGDSYLHLLSGSALSVVGKIADMDRVSVFQRLVKRLGMPMLRVMMQGFMKLISSQFVFAQKIEEGLNNVAKSNVKAPSLMSFDMLGEGARDELTAQNYFDKYYAAIGAVGQSATNDNPYLNHGVSIKLSALYARYQTSCQQAVFECLLPRLRELCEYAQSMNINLTIDAEEDARLDLSVQLIKSILVSDICRSWQGFGIALQAYQRRASLVLHELYQTAKQANRKFHVRLVKGAYWDYEIKVAQQKGLDYFPVYTNKVHSDIAYLSVAGELLDKQEVIYPMFATHNAHTVSAVIELAKVRNVEQYEFQRLHGLGQSLMEHVVSDREQFCRVYAPVGSHSDLLAYLVRRLLENGANSSFISKIHQPEIETKELCENPLVTVQQLPANSIRYGSTIYHSRQNSKGYDLDDPVQLSGIFGDREQYATGSWSYLGAYQGCSALNSLNSPKDTVSDSSAVLNPANFNQVVGSVVFDDLEAISQQVQLLRKHNSQWQQNNERALIINRIADQLEKNTPQLLAVLCREAGKTLNDGVAEVREAVDFCRYYAQQSQLSGHHQNSARGVVLCISPWNFPLAIFTGQIVAALVMGNSVIAKPAEQTCLTATTVVDLMRQAGVPQEVLQLACADGAITSAALIKSALVDLVVFTGSTATAQHIQRTIAHSAKPDTPLIAETGGINAMIVDATALLERVVDDVILSAFGSAGQRCSALRVLFIHQSIADELLSLLQGAAELLTIGDPWLVDTDVGPVIDKAAQQSINQYLSEHQSNILWQADLSDVACQCNNKSDEQNSEQSSDKSVGKGGDECCDKNSDKCCDGDCGECCDGRCGESCSKGHYIAPTIIELNSIAEISEEVFAPVLHVIRYKDNDLSPLIESINALGYGLTFALQGRLYNRQQRYAKLSLAGNVYINRDQIGAVVGSQPFGGSGLSGTGPKAGGPLYLYAFNQQNDLLNQSLPPSQSMVGVDGENNEYQITKRGKVLAINFTNNAKHPWLLFAESMGNEMTVQTVVTDGGDELNTAQLEKIVQYSSVNSADKRKLSVKMTDYLNEADVVLLVNDYTQLNQSNQHEQPSPLFDDLVGSIRQHLATIQPIKPLIVDQGGLVFLVHEKHICTNTTAAGGNVDLLMNCV